MTASTALVTTTPVWTVLLGRIWGAAVPGAWAGVGLALAGVLTVTGIDAGHGRAALVGDVLALAGGMASAGYVLVGERMRRTTSTAVYTLVAYATCAVLLLPLCAVSGTPLTGWGWRTWIELLVLTFAAQLLGHSLLNAALPVIGATALSLSILLEVPGAAVVAWLWLGSAPPWTVVPGAALVLAGLVAVIRAGRRRPSGCLRQVRPARISRAGRPVFGGELPYSAGNFRPPIESRWFGDIRHGWFGGVRYGEALIRGWRRAPAGLNSREPSMSQGRRCRPRPCRDRSGSS